MIFKPLHVVFDVLAHTTQYVAGHQYRVSVVISSTMLGRITLGLPDLVSYSAIK